MTDEGGNKNQNQCPFLVVLQCALNSVTVIYWCCRTRFFRILVMFPKPQRKILIFLNLCILFFSLLNGLPWFLVLRTPVSQNPPKMLFGEALYIVVLRRKV